MSQNCSLLISPEVMLEFDCLLPYINIKGLYILTEASNTSADLSQSSVGLLSKNNLNLLKKKKSLKVIKELRN